MVDISVLNRAASFCSKSRKNVAYRIGGRIALHNGLESIIFYEGSYPAIS